MQWVMVLSLIVLYACSILWTTVVCQGFMFHDDPPESAITSFGTVVRSLFSLFRLMNGDSDVAEAVFEVPLGQVMYVLYMIATNWAVLAILTSVVSDHMISSSQVYEREEEEALAVESERRQDSMLREIFADHHDNHLTREQWEAVLSDETTLSAMLEITKCRERQLWEAFDELAVHDAKLHRPVLPIGEFIHFVQAKGRPADLQYAMKLMARVKVLEQQNDDHRSRSRSEFGHHPPEPQPRGTHGNSSFEVNTFASLSTNAPRSPDAEAMLAMRSVKSPPSSWRAASHFMSHQAGHE